MEKRLLAIIVLILIASLAVCGCVTSTTNNSQSNTQSDKTTFTSTRGFSITYPQEWKIDTTNNANSPIKVYLYPNPNNIIDGVDVGTQKLNATTGTTLQDFSNYLLGNGVTGVSSYQNYALLSFEHTTLAGQPADKLVFSSNGS
jgi:hypothetical protein